MDFEKEAREIRTQIEKSSRGQSVICDSELPFLAQALRKAYLSGQESMRERIAAFVKPSKGAPCDCVVQYETDLGPRWLARCDCRNVGDTTEINYWCSQMNEYARILVFPLDPDSEPPSK